MRLFAIRMRKLNVEKTKQNKDVPEWVFTRVEDCIKIHKFLQGQAPWAFPKYTWRKNNNQ